MNLQVPEGFKALGLAFRVCIMPTARDMAVVVKIEPRLHQGGLKQWID